MKFRYLLPALALLFAAALWISVRAQNGSYNQFANANLGTPTTINLKNATGLPCGALPALTGDTTSSAASCATTTAKLNGTSFAGTNGDIVSFGAANIPADSGVVAANTVVASSPGAGLAHFAGSTQTVTSSAVTAADATGNTSGSGNFCLVTSCVMTTPNLGTPSALVLTNATGLTSAQVTAACTTCITSVATPTAVTIGSGANISATSLCSTTNCPAGDYDVAAVVEITTQCTTTGSYIVWLGWTDDGSAKNGSSTTTFFPFPLNGSGVPTTVGTIVPLAAGNYAQAHIVLHTTGAANNSAGSINYGTTAAACGSGGPMVGKLFLDVTRLR